ncbi:hypothetical protein [Streptomyces sp. UG1]|uniref:hypothetical protein n=1 Tax=Streptomyces sp. UG1 TaxID=3417652 RepID=UPI003CF34096
MKNGQLGSLADVHAVDETFNATPAVRLGTRTDAASTQLQRKSMALTESQPQDLQRADGPRKLAQVAVA